MGYGGVIGTEKGTIADAPVILSGKTIGRITTSLEGLSKFETVPFKVKAGTCSDDLGISLKVFVGKTTRNKTCSSKKQSNQR